MTVFTKILFEVRLFCKCVFFYLKRDGLLSTFKHLPYLMTLRLTELTDSFDKTYGTDTADNVLVQDLDVNNKTHANMYTPTSIKIFKEIMESLKINSEEYTFIDLGSGKGRVLLLASQYAFKRIIGIEFSKKLHIIAENNLKIYKLKTQKDIAIELKCIDVKDYVFPNENCILYLFNPFDGYIISNILTNLTNIKRKLIIIYYNPIFGDLIEGHGFHLMNSKKNKNLHYGWNIYHN